MTWGDILGLVCFASFWVILFLGCWALDTAGDPKWDEYDRIRKIKKEEKKRKKGGN